jgi:hypothetical protein
MKNRAIARSRRSAFISQAATLFGLSRIPRLRTRAAAWTSPECSSRIIMMASFSRVDTSAVSDEAHQGLSVTIRMKYRAIACSRRSAFISQAAMLFGLVAHLHTLD